MGLRGGLTRYAWLSIATAAGVIILKVIAYLLTGSIGFLSDALESGANIVSAIITLVALLVAARPPDEEHAFGHTKAEYLSAGAEGVLIIGAAVFIAVQAFERFINPQPLAQVGLGLVVSVAATAANLIVARILLKAGQRHRSAALTADAHHLMTDVWTSAGVIIGVAMVSLTGRLWLDPVIAMVVALQIVATGLKLVRSSANGLLDAGLPDEEVSRLRAILDHYQAEGVTYHALRTRQAGAQRFVSVHIQVPGGWSVQRGHELLEMIEYQVRQELSPVNVITHLEPVEDPASWYDAALNRED
ncbi:MAG: cation transporter [Anaerolineales bacterium]|uniref:cation diffusion facilitator family transporter n=1 Tax=Promineifilum sp. TaxID=2664178 RepID=UPI001DFEE02F|nr:cation transporter [Anaerolineales bacterium]MCO5181030.1 cation diffusion facilitator family transporter [Promineifilum sp.]